jgi:hypothetical protein
VDRPPIVRQGYLECPEYAHGSQGMQSPQLEPRERGRNRTADAFCREQHQLLNQCRALLEATQPCPRALATIEPSLDVQPTETRRLELELGKRRLVSGDPVMVALQVVLLLVATHLPAGKGPGWPPGAAVRDRSSQRDTEPCREQRCIS